MYRNLGFCIGSLLLLTVPARTAPQHYQFVGDSGSDLLGISVADVDDLTRDGVRDLVVGAYLDDAAGMNSGSLRIYSGKTGMLVHTIPGEGAGDQLGIAVAGAGDVNNDGYGDVIAGAWLADHGLLDRGRANVYSGFDGAVLFTFEGDTARDRFGASVAGGIDVNHDGHDDLIVGAPLDDPNGLESGSAYVFSGFDGSLLHVVHGQAADDQLGTSVAGIGDLDGNGDDEWLVGAPFDDHAGIDAGRATVFSGSDGSALHFFDGRPGDEFGYSVGRGRFVNADPIEDIVVCAWKNDVTGTDAGRVRVFSGANWAVLNTLDGEAPGVGLGRGGAVGVGDVNGDGRGDILVGAPFADLTGPNSGQALVFSGMDGTVLQAMAGDDAGDWMGYAVSPAGDVNGDGFPDLFVGSPQDEKSGALSGSAFVYLGNCGTRSYCTPTANSTGGPALITAQGSLSIASNSLVLVAEPCPAHQYSVFFYGSSQTYIPFGQGWLCVGGGTAGLQRLQPLVLINSAGASIYDVDLTQPPASTGPGRIDPGSTWNFQCWFRDPAAGAPAFNLSDGLSIRFCE